MIKITASPERVMQIGYEGEDSVTQIIFNYNESWLSYGDGVFKVRVLRPRDKEAYNATEVVDDRSLMTLIMTVTDIELSVRGQGELQLVYICNGAVKKSVVYKYNVYRSIDASVSVEPPANDLVKDAVDRYISDHTDLIEVESKGVSGQYLVSNGDGTYTWVTPEEDEEIDPTGYIHVDEDGENGLVLTSNGDGTYSWTEKEVEHTPMADAMELGLVDVEDIRVSIPITKLDQIARLVRQKCGISDALTIDDVISALTNTELYTQEEFFNGYCPNGDIVTDSGGFPTYAFYFRKFINNAVLNKMGEISESCFRESSIASVSAPFCGRVKGNAFYNCLNLGSVYLPKCSIIDGSVFYQCSGLSSIYIPNLAILNGSSIFNGCFSLHEIDLPKLIGVSASNIDSIFTNCRSLEEIHLPVFTGFNAYQTTTVGIRDSMFDGCTSLKKVDMPVFGGDGVYIRGNTMFRNCASLEEVYMPDMRYWPGTTMFTGCVSLKKLCIYRVPTSISASAFNAPKLEDLYVSWSKGAVSGAPWGAPSTCTIHYNTVYDPDTHEPVSWTDD